MASATGSAGGVAWVGLKGNSHTTWREICSIYGKFCRHIGASTFLSLVASIILVLLAILNAYSLYRRSRWSAQVIAIPVLTAASNRLVCVFVRDEWKKSGACQGRRMILLESKKKEWSCLFFSVFCQTCRVWVLYMLYVRTKYIYLI